jgi:hypothetical protein
LSLCLIPASPPICLSIACLFLSLMLPFCPLSSFLFFLSTFLCHVFSLSLLQILFPGFVLSLWRATGKLNPEGGSGGNSKAFPCLQGGPRLTWSRGVWMRTCDLESQSRAECSSGFLHSGMLRCLEPLFPCWRMWLWSYLRIWRMDPSSADLSGNLTNLNLQGYVSTLSFGLPDSKWEHRK